MDNPNCKWSLKDCCCAVPRQEENAVVDGPFGTKDSGGPIMVLPAGVVPKWIDLKPVDEDTVFHADVVPAVEVLELIEHLPSPPYPPEEVAREAFLRATMDVYDSARDLLLKKHQDYGPKNISDSPGGPLNGLRVRMHDKVARLNNLIDSGAEPANESIRDSYLDLMNYSAIALLVLDGDWPER